MASAAESSKFMTHFVKSYKQNFNIPYRLNRNTAKWAARDIIDSFGYDECITALEWAFYVKRDPFTWEWFAGNAEKLLKARQDYLNDLKVRAARRQRAKEWLSN